MKDIQVSHIFFSFKELKDFYLKKLPVLRKTLRPTVTPMPHKLLKYFVEHPITSAYQISLDKSFLNARYPKSYLRRLITQLSDLNLIEKVQKESKHNAKYYKLSRYGIYYILANNETLLDGFLKILLKNYADDPFFHFFLYPYIRKETLLEITDSAIFSRIFSYLHECCKKIEEVFYSINHTYNQKNGYLTDELFMWKNIPNTDHDTKRLQEFLKLKFQWDWIDRAIIEKTQDDNAIRISYGVQTVLISLNTQRTKAILTIKGKKKYEFIVREDANNDPIIDTKEFIIGNVFMTISVEEDSIRRFLIYNQARILDLIFSIISVYGRRLPALEILSEDSRFMEALEKTKEHFDKRYKFITKNKKSS